MKNMSNIVQYIILRSDLKSSLKWPMGAIIAQSCHAATAVLHLYENDDIVKSYLENLDSMHKVVLGVKDEDALRKLAEKLKDNDIKFKLWIEQPENIPTCIAIKPYSKDYIQKFVKNYQLLKE